MGEIESGDLAPLEEMERDGREPDGRARGPRTEWLAKRRAALLARIDRYEDEGHGACHLRDPRIAEIVETAPLHFDGVRYQLLEWCVMPNHVHVLIETMPGHALGDLVQSWKSFTAKEANRLLDRRGTFWMRDYFDRRVRDDAHLAAVRRYIRENPVRAKLCGAPSQWAWGSARDRGRDGGKEGCA